MGHLDDDRTTRIPYASDADATRAQRTARVRSAGQPYDAASTRAAQTSRISRVQGGGQAQQTARIGQGGYGSSYGSQAANGQAASAAYGRTMSMNPVQQQYGSSRAVGGTSPNVTYEYDDGYAAYQAAGSSDGRTGRLANKAIIAFVGFIALIILCIVLLVVWPSSSDDEAADATDAADDSSSGISLSLDFLDDWKNKAVNAVLDVTGAKEKAQGAIESQKSTIQSYTGISDAEFDAVMDGLSIPDWEVATLPSDAVEVGSMSGTYQGVDVSIVTYEDPSYVTVQVYGQEVTLDVPESAQGYVSLLEYAR